jgi:hypothetical protein
MSIVLMCVAAALVYGILHNQVTARVCVEYFTVGHPPLFATDDPTLLGIGWGTVATWWVGLLLGVPLAMVACAGRRPKRANGSLIRPIACLMAVVGFCAFASGLAGWLLAQSGLFSWSGQSLISCRPTATCRSWQSCGRTGPATWSGWSGVSWS